MATIDQEVGVVPKGAFMKTPLGEVVVNKSFQGLLAQGEGIGIMQK